MSRRHPASYWASHWASSWRLSALVFLVTIACGSLALVACGSTGDGATPQETTPAAPARGELAKATFAGGCFWCMEPPFDELDGVVATISGYIGGHQDDPTYKEVSAGVTGHTEAVEIAYDPARVSYAELLDVFWRNIDPTVKDRQFCDYGSQYRTGIFFHDDEQQRLAEASKQQIVDSGRFENVYTEITPASTFYPAEDYHQDFYKKSPVRYKSYRFGCGRDARLRQLWGE